MQFSELIAARRSVRHYRKGEIEPAKLQAILDAALEAPSAGNLQAYRIAVVDGAAAKHGLAGAAHGQGLLEQASVLLVFCADAKRSRSHYHDRGATLFALQDATIAAAYAQLAATDQGLASCWVGAFDEDRVSALLDLAAQGLRPVAILVVGHGAEQPERPARRPIAEMLVRNKH